MSRHEYMVIRNRLGQQVGYNVLGLKPYLRAAQVRLILVTHELHIFRKYPLEIAADLNQGIVA